jgi:hypothetical protein
MSTFIKGSKWVLALIFTFNCLFASEVNKSIYIYTNESGQGIMDERQKSPHPDQEKIDYYSSLKPDYIQGQIGTNDNRVNPNFNTEGSRATVEVYFCTDSYGGESSWNVFDSAGNGYYDGNYGAGWIGNNSCHSVNLELGTDDYTITLFDSYGDGGLSAGVFDPGVGTYVETFGGPYNFSYDDSRAFESDLDCGSLNNITLEVGGGSYGSEVSWDLSEGSSGVTGSYGLCLGNGEFTFNGYDSYGDGWNGNTANFSDSEGALISSFAVEGSSGSWTLTIGGPPPVAGCTDDSAENFNVEATMNDGTCTWNGGCSSASYIACGDGNCVPLSYWCDGSSEWGNAGWGPDCSDGSDEDFDGCCAAGLYADELCNPPANCEDDTACNYGVEGSCEYADTGLNCDGSIAEGYFSDCSGTIVPDSYLSWQGDGYCDDGAWGVDLNCCDFNIDDGDCGAAMGCDGVASDCGGAFEDNCGVCDIDTSNDCLQDCSGEWGGSSLLDDCGVCSGGNASCATLSFGEYSDGSVEVLYTTGADLGGFQFDITGATVTGASGGASVGFDAVSTSSSTVLGFSFSGETIPAGDNVLLTIVEISGDAESEVCLTNATLSDLVDGISSDLDVTIGDCFTLPVVTSDLVVSYDFAQDVTGFQFNVEGVEIIENSATGGAAGEYLDLVQTNATTVVGVSFSNAPIPAGTGVLTTLTVLGDVANASLSNVTLTDVNAQEVASSVDGLTIINQLPADCAGTPGGDSFTDCAGDCVAGWLAGYEGDGYCDNGAWGVDLVCDEFNNDGGDCDDDCGIPLGDNSSCADECGIPYGDNTSCADCFGEPNGPAVEDYCGVCDGSNTANECEEPSCAYTVSMIDSYGDGWNGNVLSIGESSYTIDSGSDGAGCYEGPIDVAVSCGGGSYGSEVSWVITDASGAEVLSGGAPYSGCLGSCGDVASCEDTDAGATDPYGDDCAAYNNYPSWCGGYDDDDFQSMDMCCICGGGTDGSGASIVVNPFIMNSSESRDFDIQAKKDAYISYQLEQQRRLDNPLETISLRDEDCGGAGPDVGCDGECFSGLVDDCSGECNGSSSLDDCGVCDGGNSSCSGCTDDVADNYDHDAIVDDGSCEFAPIVIEEVEELESYDSTVDIDVPEVILDEVEVNIDIPAGALDVPEGTEVTLEVSEASEAELQDIIDNSSSADADVEVYQGISFDATDENGDPIELNEGATLDVELTFEPGRDNYDLGYITEEGEIVALGADCSDNGDGSWTCAGDGPGFGSYIVYSFDPATVIDGCTVDSACNFDETATINNGSCLFPEENYDCSGECIAVIDECGDCGGSGIDEGTCDCSGTIPEDYYDCDGTCIVDTDGDSVCDELEIFGCTDESASNFDSNATENDETCEYGYNLNHQLISGNNLIGLPGYLNNSDSQNLMNSIINDGTDVIFLLGQGLGLFNTADGWSGNLTNIDPHSGYWINTVDAYSWDILFESGAVENCESYETVGGNNLMSYKWGNGNSATIDALGGETFASDNFNFILGQGLGLFNTANGWSGNLTNLEEGNGYWLNIKEDAVDFRWGFSNCENDQFGRNNSEYINPNDIMYDEFKFIQSTEQAFYLIEELTIDGIEPTTNDVVLAYNKDVLVGSAFWMGNNTAIPVMGRDFSDNTIGFSENGDDIEFKLYSASTGEIFALDGATEEWSSLLVTSINKLTGASIVIPQELTISPAFPNPFNPVTKLSFGLPNDGIVTVNVFDVNGRLVSNIQDGFMIAGSYEVEWNGNSQPSGMYLVKVQFNNEIRTEKIMLVK